MRDLFYTTTRPKHSFKSEQWLRALHRLQRKSGFGVRVRDSFFKKMLIFKRFFKWFYRVKKIATFRRLLSRGYLRRRFTYRGFASFFLSLEYNLLVSLVRSGFCNNLDAAYFSLHGRFVFVNGHLVACPFYSMRIGDIVEYDPNRIMDLLPYTLPNITFRQFAVYRQYFFQESARYFFYFHYRLPQSRLVALYRSVFCYLRNL